MNFDKVVELIAASSCPHHDDATFHLHLHSYGDLRMLRDFADHEIWTPEKDSPRLCGYPVIIVPNEEPEGLFKKKEKKLSSSRKVIIPCSALSRALNSLGTNAASTVSVGIDDGDLVLTQKQQNGKMHVTYRLVGTSEVRTGQPMSDELLHVIAARQEVKAH